MELAELLRGKTITEVRAEDGLLYLHLGADECVVALQVNYWGAVEQDGATLQ